MLINGIAYWAKILGAPVQNKFDETKKQWSFDLSIDKETQQKLLKAGMRKSFIKNKNDDRGAFITFVRDAVRKDGSEGKPIEVVGPDGSPWDHNKLIGNGSELNVRVALNEREFNGQKFLKPSVVAVQVYDHVPFEFVNKDDSFPIKNGEKQNEASEGSW